MGQVTYFCCSNQLRSPTANSTTERSSMTNCSQSQNINLKDQVKIMIVGTKSSGKTTLLNNLIINNQKQIYYGLKQIPHGGIQFKTIQLKLDDINIQHTIKCRFIDVEGNFFQQLEHIKKLIPSCDGFIIMCDMSNVNSIQEAQEILKYLEKGQQNKHILVLANKSDLQESFQNQDLIHQITSTVKHFYVNTCSLVECFKYKEFIQQIAYASSLINLE
ncbi:elongation factor Tu GTP-binding domain protein (macronuclear) [Tetrahymena thermophila SB210]|uniref:Elongation factor Tu GTP-binding domain protein n=1 Tax=Tetrahymena thermophila (strain SB210) TaxID=312017 RepID=I7MGR3_TETTS|nr:elongation factor Tu GTP-binding domain protein [Tetrahymena thermophila SB210]EAS01940.1 elongation factor Tu GTP-binding domain protein [Tetrahymena thermophila SB210]|eukprot:XP_001022185.1 elongation factor Tu GTP-binding domain protein [Tetrahymena thermophila SB210]